MKIRFSAILLVIVALGAITSCKNNKGSNWYFNKTESTKPYDENPIQGDTAIVRNNRTQGDFNEVEINDAAKVTIHIGPKCNVVVSGEKVYADAQKAEVSGNVMKIGFDDDMSRHQKTSVELWAPSLDAVRLHNVSNVVLDGQDNTVDDFEISLKRVTIAHFNSPVKANKVIAQIDGMTYGNFFLDCESLEWTSRHITHAKIIGNVREKHVDEERKGTVEFAAAEETQSEKYKAMQKARQAAENAR